MNQLNLLHDGILHVITNISRVIENGEVIEGKHDLKILIFDSEYGFDSFKSHDKTKDHSHHDFEFKNCMGILYLTKGGTTKRKTIRVNDYDDDTRKYESFIGIFDSESSLTEAISHNPRHRVIDPIGG